MIVHWNIKQRTSEWLALKWGKVGGSNADELFNYTKGNPIFFEILAQRYELPPVEYLDTSFSAAMRKGVELEPEAMLKAIEKTGIKFKDVGCVTSDVKTMCVSPDGLTLDCAKALEIKCPDAKEHMRTIAEGINVKYIYQIAMYFAVIDKLEELYFVSYRPECLWPLHIKIVTRNTLFEWGKRPVYSYTIQEIVDKLRQNGKQLDEDLKSFTPIR